jgi:hypothetical protein
VEPSISANPVPNRGTVNNNRNTGYHVDGHDKGTNIGVHCDHVHAIIARIQETNVLGIVRDDSVVINILLRLILDGIAGGYLSGPV